MSKNISLSWKDPWSGFGWVRNNYPPVSGSVSQDNGSASEKNVYGSGILVEMEVLAKPAGGALEDFPSKATNSTSNIVNLWNLIPISPK